MAEPNCAGLPHATPHGSGRHEKSLGLLTVKFVNLLQEAKDGVLDLKVAADSLAVKQKRRIYDITNVLEGIGLIEKKTKNTIQWKGERSGCQPQDILERVTRLKENIAKLELKERELDMQNACLEQNIKHVNEEPSSYQYVTHEDICDAFGGETLLAVMAPSGTQLEVPVPELSHNGQKKYQMNLRSHTAPIQVMLINRETSGSKPVVFSVPPVENISAMPTPPTTPAGLQRFPVSSSETCHLKSSSLQGPEAEHHLPHSATSSDMHMECNPESPSSQSFLLQESPAVPQSVHQQQKEMGGQDLQSMLDEMREERGVSNLIDELMSSDVFPLLRLSPNPGVDYNFNLDDNEGVCDLFDVQILNY